MEFSENPVSHKEKKDEQFRVFFYIKSIGFWEISFKVCLWFCHIKATIWKVVLYKNGMNGIEIHGDCWHDLHPNRVSLCMTELVLLNQQKIQKSFSHCHPSATLSAAILCHYGAVKFAFSSI